MINLLEHIKNNGRIGMGAYIAFCSLKGTPSQGWVYKIVSTGKSYEMGLSLAISGSTPFPQPSVKVKSVGDISEEEIVELIEKLWKSYSYNEGIDIEWEDIRILEPDEVIDLFKRSKRSLGYMVDCKLEKV